MLAEYNQNYRKSAGSLWNYTKDISVYPIKYSESLKYKTSFKS